MIKQVTLLLVIVLLFIGKDCYADYWARKSNFPAGPKHGAFAFSVGNNAYLGGSYLGSDFWVYDPIYDSWTRKADLPFLWKIYAHGFNIGNKGYVWGGSDTSTTISPELWEYDPINDTWTQKTSSPSGGYSWNYGFVINNKAYLQGFNNSFFFVYNPITNSWGNTQLFPFNLIQTNGFTILNTAYITGTDTNGIQEVWKYIPANDTWEQKNNFNFKARDDANSFSIGNIGYFGMGDTGTGGVMIDWYQYDAIADTWIPKAWIACHGLDENTAFVLNNNGYLCFGSDLGIDSSIWEYTPDSLSTLLTLSMVGPPHSRVCPCPFVNSFSLQNAPSGTAFYIRNAWGRIISFGNTKCCNERIGCSTWIPGNYTLELLYADGNRETLQLIKN